MARSAKERQRVVRSSEELLFGIGLGLDLQPPMTSPRFAGLRKCRKDRDRIGA